MLRASKSPVVVHCLGAEVVLNLTPKGGYKDSGELTAPDKGKGRAQDNDRIGSPRPRAGPSRHLEQDSGNQVSFIPGPEVNESPKGRARDNDRVGSPPAEPHAGPSRHRGQDGGNQVSFIPGPEINESPIVVEHVDEATAAVDTVRQCRSLDAGGTPDPKAPHSGPGMEMARHEEPKQGRIRKKKKVTKVKSKASVPEISMTLSHGDCVVLYGDNFEVSITPPLIVHSPV